MAACWESATADLVAREMDQPGVRLRYYLNRRPLITLHVSHTGATQRSLTRLALKCRSQSAACSPAGSIR
ncbi:DUF6207 family protein [Streptomyces sp. GMY02]|uniref:DUF6207 family protein n=1 Tax=Streptomyces sp. GMY02 TaxID=1333528 RepID=UPI0026661B8C|nr:DUF6207 family protein [Streptomyces sp. GMY02]